MPESRSIDLHGKTVAQAIADFTAFYNRAVREGFRGRVEAIHGYGSSGVGGQIKPALRQFLEARAASFTRIVYAPGNPGLTAVIPKSEIELAHAPADGKTRRITPLPARRGQGSGRRS